MSQASYLDLAAQTAQALADQQIAQLKAVQAQQNALFDQQIAQVKANLQLQLAQLTKMQAATAAYPTSAGFAGIGAQSPPAYASGAAAPP